MGDIGIGRPRRMFPDHIEVVFEKTGVLFEKNNNGSINRLMIVCKARGPTLRRGWLWIMEEEESKRATIEGSPKDARREIRCSH